MERPCRFSVMIRLIGAALLMGAGLWMGLGAAGQLSRRVRDLETWLAALELLESELAFRSPDLPGLFETMSHRTGGCAGSVFAYALGSMERLGEWSFDEIWTAVLSEEPGGLDAGDLELLDRLGGILGRYGREEQQRLMEAVREALARRAEEARSERERKGKAYGVLGLSVGAFAAILLI